jgi:hypothetical protein
LCGARFQLVRTWQFGQHTFLACGMAIALLFELRDMAAV